MIEAVNSVLSNAQVLRGGAEQVDASRSPAAAPETTREIAVPKAPFISPFLSIDVNFDTTVLQIRDSDTGDVINQFPSESRLQQIRRDAAADARAAEIADTSSASQTAPAQTIQAQISVQEQEVRTPPSSIPQAQVATAALATAALATAAQTSINNLSAGVSVAA